MAIQDRDYQQRQLAVLCLKTLVSPKLHFNICSLESSIVKNADLQATAKSTVPRLVSYSCQYWADHLVHTPSDKMLIKGEEQFWIEGLDFVFIRHDGRIASTHWINNEGASDDSENEGASDDSEDEDRDQTRIVVKLWDASNGALISDRLFEVNDVTGTRFSPNGRFLAVAGKSESVIELWNVEDGKDPRRFSYPPGDLESLVFSPTSDSFMAVSQGNAIYVWQLDTQEMASFDHDFSYVPHVIHSPLTNYLFIRQDHTVKIWDVSMTGSKLIWETNPPTTSRIWGICHHRMATGF